MVFQDSPPDPDRESPGQKLEAVARGDGLDWTHATVRRDNELGILDKVSVGVYVAYTVHEDKRAAPRQYRIGRVTTVGRAEMLVVCHKYLPTMYTHRLRVEWTPAYLDADGQESIAPSARPVLERVVVRRIITPCTLNQGVVNHSTTRKLDTSKWVYEGAGSEAQVALIQQPAPAIAQAARDFLSLSKSSVFKGSLENRVTFATDETRQKWMVEGFVDFLQILSLIHILTQPTIYSV